MTPRRWSACTTQVYNRSFEGVCGSLACGARSCSQTNCASHLEWGKMTSYSSTVRTSVKWDHAPNRRDLAGNVFLSLFALETHTFSLSEVVDNNAIILHWVEIFFRIDTGAGSRKVCKVRSRHWMQWRVDRRSMFCRKLRARWQTRFSWSLVHQSFNTKYEALNWLIDCGVVMCVTYLILRCLKRRAHLFSLWFWFCRS